MNHKQQLDAAGQKMTAGDLAEALLIFEQIAGAQPAPFVRQEAMIGTSRALAHLGRIAQATDVAQKALDQWPNAYPVLLLNAECAKLAGEGADEEAFLRQAFSAEPDKQATARPLCEKLLATGQWGEVQKVYDTFVANTGRRKPLLAFLAMKHTKAGDASAGLALWRKIHDQPHASAATKQQAIKGIAKCLVQSGAYSDLRKLFDDSPETGPERPALLTGMPPNPGDDGLHHFPNSLLRETAEKNPKDASAEAAYQQRLTQLGTFEGFQEVASRQYKARGIVRTNLREQIAAISTPQAPMRVTHKLLAFWKLCGEPYGTLNDWLIATRWEARANDLVRLFTCLEVEGEDEILEQISDITVAPDYSLIHEALEQNKGCLLAGSHLGPVWGHAFLTSRHFDNLGIIGARLRPRLGRGSKDVSMQTEPLKARRDIQKYLSQNAIMWCGPDSVHKEGPTNLFDSAFGPLPVQISYAHIQFRTGAPGLWSERYWKDKQIHFAFKKMPSAEPGETLRDYTKRWCETYLAYLTDLIKHRIADSRYAHIIGRDWSY